jgi:hypothetical protein
MLFRYILVVSDVAISEGVVIRLNYDSVHPVTIEIAKDNREDQTATITATTQFEADRHHPVFRALGTGRLPEGAQPYMAGDKIVQPGEDLGGYIPDPSVLPQSFQSLIEQVSRELSDAAKKSWRMLHWRYNIDASRARFSSRGMQWSWNGDSWHTVPMHGSGVAHVLHGVPSHPHAGAETEALLRAGVSAPLAYEMLQEAIDLQTAAPRAALAIAVAALEIGVKSFIAELVPDARWLAQEVPSPPVVAMLRDYVPQLPARLRIDDRIVPPPRQVLERLKDGINKRNQLTHVGVEGVDGQFLKEVIEAVSDSLRLLDYYSGQAWALQWLTQETIEELGLSGRITYS